MHDKSKELNFLKEKFTKAMFQTYWQAKELCDYNAVRFLQMVQERGGWQTARDLLNADSPQAGLMKLWECGRLDISMEAHVLMPEFGPLFTDAEREIARQRLQDFGYEIDNG